MPRSDLTADGAFGLSDTQLQTLPQALRERVQELQLIVDSIPGFVAVLSTSGQAEMANRGVLEYLGTRCEDLRLGDTSDHVHPDDLPGVVAAWARAASTGTLIEYEHRLRRLDGVYRWFSARGRPLRDGANQILRWYVLLTDIDDHNGPASTASRPGRTVDGLRRAGGPGG